MQRPGRTRMGAARLNIFNWDHPSWRVFFKRGVHGRDAAAAKTVLLERIDAGDRAAAGAADLVLELLRVLAGLQHHLRAA